jgi:hypothetical protein
LPWRWPLLDDKEGSSLKGRRWMLKRTQADATFALKCALLFLAFSVFGLGLNAKLSLYKAQQSPETVAAAKLTTEKRTAQSALVLKVVREPLASSGTWTFIALTAFHHILTSPAFRLDQVEMSLCSPCRGDSQSSSLLNRPPPTLS